MARYELTRASLSSALTSLGAFFSFCTSTRVLLLSSLFIACDFMHAMFGLDMAFPLWVTSSMKAGTLFWFLDWVHVADLLPQVGPP